MKVNKLHLHNTVFIIPIRFIIIFYAEIVDCFLFVKIFIELKYKFNILTYKIHVYSN